MTTHIFFPRRDWSVTYSGSWEECIYCGAVRRMMIPLTPWQYESPDGKWTSRCPKCAQKEAAQKEAAAK